MKLKGLLSEIFNMVTGKRGFAAAVTGYLSLAFITVAVVTAHVPMFAMFMLGCSALSGEYAFEFADKHDAKKGLTP